jgi:hypothetical protein
MTDNTTITAPDFHAWNLMCEEHADWMFQEFESTFRDKYKNAEGSRSAVIDPREAYLFILKWCARATDFEQNKAKELERFLVCAKKHGEVA